MQDNFLPNIENIPTKFDEIETTLYSDEDDYAILVKDLKTGMIIEIDKVKNNFINLKDNSLIQLTLKQFAENIKQLLNEHKIGDFS